MEISAILEALTVFTERFPREALKAAIAQRDAVTPHLLAALENAPVLLKRLQTDEDYMLHLYAFYLLAQFRERRAYPLIVDFFSLPGDEAFDMTGDFVTESLGQVLASVSGGDITYMKRLVEDPEVNEYVRSAAMTGIVTLVGQGVVTREGAIAYFRGLFHGGLQRTYDFVWSALVDSVSHLYPEELMPEIQQTFADDLVDEMFVSLSDVERTLVEGEAATLAWLREDRHHQLINDTIAELQWWACFRQAPPQPRAKPGRNSPCPCGSGRKYKHCCGKR